jgi:hypothetical protein
LAEDGGSYRVSTLVGLIFMLVISPFFPVGARSSGGSSAATSGPRERSVVPYETTDNTLLRSHPGAPD